jgi:ankyrin repeat protein
VVRLLLAHQGVEVNKAEPDGCTAMHAASRSGHVDVVRLLLARQDLEVNKSMTDGATALHWASQNGHVEVVQLLLARPGVEVNKSDPDGWTALQWAALKGHVGVVQLLSRARTSTSTRPRRTGPRRCTRPRGVATSTWCGSCSRTRASR